MTINIQKCSNVTVIGHRTRRNCKAVYNITTGEMYASVLDAANALGVSQGALSFSLDDDKERTCKGMRLCFQSKMMEHLEEINQMNRIRANKVAAYDADMARRAEICKRQAKLEELEASKRKLMQEVAEVTALVAEAERELHELTNN